MRQKKAPVLIPSIVDSSMPSLQEPTVTGKYVEEVQRKSSIGGVQSEAVSSWQSCTNPVGKQACHLLKCN